MSNYYLRVEGANLANFVYDTNDLSTIRGGSVLLKDLTRFVEASLSNMGRDFEPIATGGSAGVFRLKGVTAESATDVETQIDELIRGDAKYRHSTVMVSVVRDDGDDFRVVAEKLLALNRFRQVQRPTLAVPSGSESLVCQVDGVRPGAIEDWKGERRLVSQSVAMRRKHGKEKKSDLAKIADADAPQDFEELTSAPPKGYEHLNHKMAVIVADGTGFAKVQDAMCTTEKRQQDFDRALQDKAQTFLEGLALRASGEAWYYEKDKLRVEVLVAAGDDFRIVVPAWLGWTVLEAFFEHMRDWQFEGQPLRYKAGIVLCHHNAPIRRIVAVADGLSHEAKDSGRNSVRYLVLESFDDAGPDLGSFLRKRQVSGTEARDYLLRGDDLEQIRRYMTSLRGFPRNKLHKIVQELHAGRPVKGLIDRAKEDMPRAGQEAVERIHEVLGAAGWVHLWELWDYLPVEEDRHA